MCDKNPNKPKVKTLATVTAQKLWIKYFEEKFSSFLLSLMSEKFITV